MGLLQEAAQNAKRGLRRTVGLTGEPRKVVGRFKMIPEESEQQMLINWSADKLSNGLITTNTDTTLIASVAYDLVNALGDKESAKTILKDASVEWGKERMQMSLAAVLFVRTNTDKSTRIKEKPFIEFCSKAGFDISKITLGAMRAYFVEVGLDDFLSQPRRVGNY